MLFIAFNNFTNNPAATNNTPTSNQAPTSGWAALAQVGANVTASVLNQRQQNQQQQNQAQRNLVEPAGNNPVYSSMINSALPGGFRETFPISAGGNLGGTSTSNAPTTLLTALANYESKQNDATKDKLSKDKGYQAFKLYAESGQNIGELTPREREALGEFKRKSAELIAMDTNDASLMAINRALADLNLGTIQRTGVYSSGGFANGGWTGAVGSVLGGLGDWMRTRRS